MLSTKEVAERLGASHESIRAWIKQTPSRFPNAQKIGRDWVVPETDLEGFVVRPRGRPRKSGSSADGHAAAAKPKKAKKMGRQKK